MRKFTISDIHGCAQTFQHLVEEDIVLEKDDILYLLGDYIDRGPDSKGVIDYILQLKEEGYQLKCLRGNHEQLMLQAKNSLDVRRSWYARAGGLMTMNSFGCDTFKEIPVHYWDFMSSLDYFIEEDGYIFVHGGLNFKDGSNPLRNYESTLWQRDWYFDINYDWLGDRSVIHGHTPQNKMSIKELFYNFKNAQVLNIDNGCFTMGEEGFGSLCAYDLTNHKLYFRKRKDDSSDWYRYRKSMFGRY